MPTIKTGIRFSKKQPLSEQELRQLHAYWRAANYLTACQLYLMDIPLLERRQVLLIKMMAVGGKNYLLPHCQDSIIGKNRKVKHHLVYFRVTVSPYAQDMTLYSI